MVPCLVFECRPPAPEWELFPVWQFNAPPSNVIPTEYSMRERTEDGKRTTWELPLTSTNLPGDLYLGFQKLRRIEFTATARSLPKSAPTVPKP